ncbi:MAG TPA: hypothetical protein VM557_03865 [Thermoanaerobaculia bacterium]|nr:hypothetical protein [Thermoanaerobaculia bacterium]
MEAMTFTAVGMSMPGAPSLLWTDVVAVSAMRRADGDAEALTLRLQLRDGQSVEVSEGMTGFTHLVGMLPEVLPGFPEQNEWFYEAAEGDSTSEHLLYEASSESAH